MLSLSNRFSTRNFFTTHLVLKHSFSSLQLSGLTRGDIVLLKAKQKDASGDVVHQKGRPHIIVSSDKVVKVTGRLILAPLSSGVARLHYEATIPSGKETGLHEVSKVMANQIHTASLKEAFLKIGSGARYLPQISTGLSICFGDDKVNKTLEISRGDIVKISFGRFIRSGVVVSNDLGNKASRIAMLAHSHEKNEAPNEFDLIVRKNEGGGQEQLLVQCYMINTLSQERMVKTGQIVEEDIESITAMIYKTLGIVE